MSEDNGDSGASSVYEEAEWTNETLQIEQRLIERGYGPLPQVLSLAGDFEFEGSTVEEIVEEARKYLLHQYMVEEVGARVLSAIGEAAVKAQAFDAITRVYKKP